MGIRVSCAVTMMTGPCGGRWERCYALCLHAHNGDDEVEKREEERGKKVREPELRKDEECGFGLAAIDDADDAIRHCPLGPCYVAPCQPEAAV